MCHRIDAGALFSYLNIVRVERPVRGVLYSAGLLTLSCCQSLASPAPPDRLAIAQKATAQKHVSSAYHNAAVQNAANNRELEVPINDPTVVNFSQFVGVDEGKIEGSLGRPASINESPPGKTWSYRDGDCTLTVAFYPEVETRTFRALSYEVTTNDRDSNIAKLCRARFATAIAGK